MSGNGSPADLREQAQGYSEQFLRGLLSLDGLLEGLEEINKMWVDGPDGPPEDLLESLKYVEGLLDDIVESSVTVPVVFRLPADLVDRLDAYVERLNGADPATRVTRTAVVRQLLMAVLEREHTSE